MWAHGLHAHAAGAIRRKVVHAHRFLAAHGLCIVLACSSATAEHSSAPPANISTPTVPGTIGIGPCFMVLTSATKIISSNHATFHGFDEGFEIRDASREEGKKDDDLGTENRPPHLKGEV